MCLLFTRSQDVANPRVPLPPRLSLSLDYRLIELPCIDFAEDGPVRINWFMHRGSMLNTLIEVLYTVVSNLGYIPWIYIYRCDQKHYTKACNPVIARPRIKE